jgi:hypothetical protein
MVYYFSFDNGRQTAKARIERLDSQKLRLEAEVDSLREQLALQGAEIQRLRSALGAAGLDPGGEPGAAGAAGAAAREGGQGAAEGARAKAKAKAKAPGPAGAAAQEGGEAAAEGGEALAGAGGEIPDQPPGLAIGGAGEGAAPKGPDLSIPQAPRGEGGQGLSDPKAVTRLTLRPGESRLILGDRVRLSVLSTDSLDKVAQVSVQSLDTEARQSKTMGDGDTLIIQMGAERHLIILDQLKGSAATFILIDR